jgi:eukaryotic-like serine/threonine-protein kinase
MSAADRLSAALQDRYGIERELGAGGMATVYLAEDLKHHRQVAIKVLKPELAAVLGAERFVQEIATTAQLQHPNILPLFDSGEADGLLYYVMPYVEGESLRDKLNRETQLSIDDAVKITTEVADALDYAHRHGVIHRDIKPENILLHDGRPMVADFGIALAVSAAAGGRMTETGLSLGTPHYMSPEQATAERDITGRSDIYSLGAVLYEMLTGDPPHVGKTAQQIIAKIVTDVPRPVTEIRKSVPPNVAAALSQALEKLPADRFESAKAFAEALTNPAFAVTAEGAAHAGRGGGAGWKERAALPLAVAAGVLLIAALWGWLRPRPVPPLIRYRLELPADAEFFDNGIGPAPAPDGSFLTYLGPNAAGDGDRLWIKRRDDDRPTPIAGTDGAVSFAVSPDGSSIAFTGPAAGMLRRVPVHGGAPVTIADGGVAPLAGLTWLDTNTLVVPNIDINSLETIPVTGGTPTVVYHTDSARVFQPVALPDGRGLLFGRCFAYCAVAELWALDLRSGKAHRVLGGVSGSSAYLMPGYVVYNTPAGGLFAIAFDLDGLEVHGEPIAIADSVPAYFSIGADPFHVSRSGTLIMEIGSPPGQRRYDMVWVDAHGRVTPADTTWTFELTNSAGNRGWALSPDGRQLAAGLHTASGDGIWVKQLPDGPLHKVTNDSAPAYRPHWTADGRDVTFVGGNQSPGFFMHRADGVGDDSLLVRGFFDEGLIVPGGKWYVLRTGHVGPGVGGRHMLEFRPGADSGPVPLITAGKAHDIEAAAVSPDGRWIAYNSNESGQLQVYVRPFSEVNAAKWQVSRAGGVAPLWSRDGARLFYLRADGTMMTVRVTPGASPPLGDPVPMFVLPVGVDAPNGNYTPWDVAPDGRFIMARAVAAEPIAPRAIVVVENWLQHWKRSLGK